MIWACGKLQLHSRVEQVITEESGASNYRRKQFLLQMVFKSMKDKSTLALLI